MFVILFIFIDKFILIDKEFDYKMILIIIIGEGTSKLTSKSSTRILLMSFILFCLILRSIFTSEMYKYFNCGAFHPAVDTFEEFNSRKFTFYAPKYLKTYVSLNQLRINQRFVKTLIYFIFKI